MSPLWRSRETETPKTVEGPFPPLIGRVLAARGYRDPSQIEKLLFPKIGELKDPFAMKGMQQAVERIAQAFLKKEKICIYADFDLDGTSGLALLKTGMQALGFADLVHYQPKRLSEGYGFHASAVRELSKQGVSLIITVDVGITAHEAAHTAKERGVDVIITDHHLPAETLPEAFVIVNPNQGECPSQLGFLCGAGVAFYLLRALKRYFHDHAEFPKNDFDLKEVLDFFTIATLTDMVPLVEDNRVLVKTGLALLGETKKPGLRALLEELALTERALTSQDVAIRFAPKLNALSRMESGILPIDIFLVRTRDEAIDMVRQVMKNNSTRVQLQSDAEQEALELLKSWPHEDFVFVASPRFHRGVVGLIATKLTQVYNKPAFVGSIGEDGVIVGSARLPQGQESCLVEAMTSAADLLNRFGGHSAAAGFEILQSRTEAFVEQLASYYREQKEKPKPLEIFYDVKAELMDVGSSLMKWYDFVGPFGSGFAIPVFLFKNLRMLSKKDLKGGHFRLRLSDASGKNTVEALLFTPTPRQIDELARSQGHLDILGELQWNYFGGQKTIQILIKDLKHAQDNSAQESL
jgi:single-stranded-DNA-specific exonuclease